jgi:hypothetical protein
MQKTEKQPLFDLGQLVATPGALAALKKSGQTPSISCRAMCAGIGGNFLNRTRPKTSSAWKRAFGYRAATACIQVTPKFGSSPRPTVPTLRSFFPRSTEMLAIKKAHTLDINATPEQFPHVREATTWHFDFGWGMADKWSPDIAPTANVLLAQFHGEDRPVHLSFAGLVLSLILVAVSKSSQHSLFHPTFVPGAVNLRHHAGPFPTHPRR